MANSTTLTGNEAFWGNVKITPQALALINKSPTLVAELQAYGAAVIAGTMGAMQQGTTGAIAFEPNGVVFANNYQSWTPEILVGNLAHEIGHFMNAGADAAFRAEYTVSPGDPNAYGLNAMIGLHQEGEAAYNNWVVQNEIKSNGGSQIYLAGQWATDSNGNTLSTGLQELLDKQHALDLTGGVASSADKQWMIEDAMGVFATIPNSVSGENYFTYYGEANGAKPPAPGDLTGATFGDANGTGNIGSIRETFSSGDSATQYFSGSTITSSVTTDQFGNVLTQTVYSHNADGSYVANIYDAHGDPTGQEQFHSDGSETAVQFNRDGSQNATVYDSHGNKSEYASFGTNGKITQDILYDATTGRETQEIDWNADGSWTTHLLNANGSENAIAYDAAGRETEYATFGTNGKITQDTFYDVATGRATERDDYNADGSAVANLFHADGSQDQVYFNAAGHQTEQASFGTNGKITQDILYDAATGRETQERDWSADGSSVAHLYNSNGTQNAIAYDAAGRETEYATFGTNGKLTQDTFYDVATGRATERDDYNADGSAVANLFHADGSQDQVYFNAAGHQTEQASFGTNGKITQDILYDAATGRETQERDWSADGSSVAHLYNSNGTQNAIAYDAAGRETEYATFGTNGKLTQDTFYDATTGRATEQDDYNADGSGTAHIFNADGTQNSAMFDPSGHVSEYATFAANGALTSDAFFDKNGRETELIEFSGNQQIVHLLNADNSQTAIVYNGNGQEVEYASFNTSGQKTDDWFWDGPSGRLIEYDQYGSNGSMTAHQFNANGTQDAIIFNGNGQEMEYDSYDTNGNLTGFTQFTYGVGGGYNAVAYGPTGYETGWADYGSNNMLVSSGGNQYNFTLDDSYDSGSDDYDFGWFDDMSYSNEYGFYI
ncbi:hypothetical protein [Paraburkholderia fynbosensis]|uniref:Uncharacterized protein n=1 Tax=Paraburkholderia fynbosensis TaxID=1200993 RepID=A0A6J5GFP8_9BURK|nr:hypothetical protein [Paraburkholderia fynbosensis]CAB3799649.1 hypothetical protein LMG27177_04683 [Paraburkholderia fynbosensis]